MLASPAAENYGCTATELGRFWVEKIAATLPAHVRLTRIRRPEVTWQATPHCHPDFLLALRDAWRRLDLDDPAQWSPDAARVLRAYQSLGLERLFLRSLSAGDLCAVTEEEIEHGLDGCRLGLAALIGNAVFTLLGADAVAQWCPHHMFSVEPSRSGHAWSITVDALQTVTGARGQVRYMSAKCPRVGLRKRRLPLAFSVHAMQRLAERNTLGTGDYTDTRSTFNLIRGARDFDVVRSAPGQWLVALFWPCVYGYATWQFAESILPTRRPDVSYKFRFGYLAVEEEGGYWVAKTFLPPGYVGTPEYTRLSQARLPTSTKARLLAQCQDLSFERLCCTMDMTVLKWFHEHGIPQVIPYATPAKRHAA
jgi:hypothetical protein